MCDSSLHGSPRQRDPGVRRSLPSNKSKSPYLSRRGLRQIDFRLWRFGGSPRVSRGVVAKLLPLDPGLYAALAGWPVQLAEGALLVRETLTAPAASTRPVVVEAVARCDALASCTHHK